MNSLTLKGEEMNQQCHERFAPQLMSPEKFWGLYPYICVDP